MLQSVKPIKYIYKQILAYKLVKVANFIESEVKVFETGINVLQVQRDEKRYSVIGNNI